MNTVKKALIAGDTGIIGRHLTDYLSNLGSYNVVGVSRGATYERGAYRHEQADLLDPDSIASALAAHPDIDELYYVARSPQESATLEDEINGIMFANVTDAALYASPGLAHVHLMEGMKWYGSHLGTWKTPAREDDARHIPPNMYYTQQDWIESRLANSSTNWSALRPHQVCGFSDVYPHNAMGVIALYGAICAHLNLPLRFPGTQACFESVSMVTDATLLARAMHWCASAPAAQNLALNVGNGDYFRWSNLWPHLAEFFGIEAGPVQTISLEQFMSDKASLWQEIVQQHGLRQPDFDALVSWTYGDFTFRAGWDDMASTTAIRKAGFLEFVDSQEMFIDVLQQYRSEKIIP